MRQVGVLAAAGLMSLETMTQRLEEDHRNARLLADRWRNSRSEDRPCQRADEHRSVHADRWQRRSELVAR